MNTHAGAHAPAARFRDVLAAALAVAVLAACSRSPEPAAAPAAAPVDSAASADGTIHPEQWPELAWPLPADPALEKKVDDLLATMTLEEKVGQLIQGDIGSITPDDVRKYRLGSILAGGSSDPGGKYNATPPAPGSGPAPRRPSATARKRLGGNAEQIVALDAGHRSENDQTLPA